MSKTLITILGPTASGKTHLATQLASHIKGEIISADSRQIYRGMDIGTGKDLDEYTVNGQDIPYHLIDIKDPGYEYNVFEFQQDFLNAFNAINDSGNQAILCGGTGMYLNAALSKEKMMTVPENTQLRKELEELSDNELVKNLNKLKQLHNTTDSTERSRTIRAIEIETFKQNNSAEPMPEINHQIFGVDIERDLAKRKITERLMQRLNGGMIKEVETLLNNGITPEQLKFYGLEYKYVTEFLTGELDFNDMYQKLNSAIHTFAKKQMTWFRRMEKQGYNIQWIDHKKSSNQKIEFIQNQINS